MNRGIHLGRAVFLDLANFLLRISLCNFAEQDTVVSTLTPFAVFAMAPFNAACDRSFDGAGDVRNTGATRDLDGHQPVSGLVLSGGQRR